MPDGRPCGAPPLRHGNLCFWHEPGRSDDLADAQHLGGVRRRRERTLATAYDVVGLDSVPAIRRVVLIAILDTLGLENTVARNRTLIAGGLAAAKLLETGELEARIAALEATVGQRSGQPDDETIGVP
jgi:hypothetical protein